MHETIGIIGLGTIGSAIAAGLAGAECGLEIVATRRTNEAPACVPLCSSNVELVQRCSTVLLCVKPQQLSGILSEIARHVTEEHLIISACAGVSLETIARQLTLTRNIVRAMPNVPCEINAGVTALAAIAQCAEDRRRQAYDLFRHLGEVVTVEERHFDAVTAISGCGPAYICVIIEALTDAGVKQGLPREVARLLVAQTVLGSADLVLQSQMHPALIRDRVTTPAGCTIDALTALEDGKVRHALITAVSTAATKSAKLTAGG